MVSRNPFYLMAGLYLLVDALALGALGLVSAAVLPALPGLSWLQVHLLTIGVVTQAILGTLPGLAAARPGQQRREERAAWAIWLLVNVSFLLLQMSMPAGRGGVAAVAAGGIFAAVLLTLSSVVYRAREAGKPTEFLRFHLAGPSFFLVGIVMAVSMLLGLPAPGGAVGLLEAHVHANVWGFLGIVVAGVLLEQVPVWTGRPLRYSALVPATSLLLIAGTAGLVAGPWLALLPLTMLGLALYVAGTAALLANLVGTALASRGWTPNLAHLLVAYVWMLVPVFVAPAVLAATGRLPGGAIEAAAVSGLVAGWVLQVVLGALVPRLGEEVGPWWRYDGTWFAVLALNLGVLSLWLAAFLPAGQVVFTPVGYGLVLAGLAPAVAALLARWVGGPGPARSLRL